MDFTVEYIINYFPRIDNTELQISIDKIRSMLVRVRTVSNVNVV